MDYQKARGIKKRSLLSLITEQKFGEGKGLGSSVGGAISQKFKAKATGIKESLDPMNWLRKSMGMGAVGDFAVSAWGKMRGRSNKDIEALPLIDPFLTYSGCFDEYTLVKFIS